ncbi:MAG: transcription antitermination factor NusB [Actinomycetota bacterium]
MTSRRDARRAALDILYQADMMQRDPRVVLAEWADSGRPVPDFTREIVEGTADALPELDEVLERLAEGWTVERMASVDRSVLRVACFEVLHRPDVPVAAAIDEAVDAAKELSTDDSGRFVNGVLGHLARERAGAPEQS